MAVLIDFITGLITSAPKDISLGRMAESVVLFWIIWSKLKPHLKKVEDRLEGVESAVKNGFNSGEQRFEKIEDRLIVLEKQKPTIGGVNYGKTF